MKPVAPVNTIPTDSRRGKELSTSFAVLRAVTALDMSFCSSWDRSASLSKSSADNGSVAPDTDASTVDGVDADDILEVSKSWSWDTVLAKSNMSRGDTSISSFCAKKPRTVQYKMIQLSKH